MASGSPMYKEHQPPYEYFVLQLISLPRIFPINKTFHFPSAISMVISNVNFPLSNSFEQRYSSITCNSRHQSQRAQTVHPLISSEPVEQCTNWSNGSGTSITYPLLNGGWNEKQGIVLRICWSGGRRRGNDEHRTRPCHAISEWATPLTWSDGRYFSTLRRGIELVGAGDAYRKSKNVDNCLSTALQTLVRHTVRKFVNSLESMSWVLNTFIDNRRFNTLEVVLVRSKQPKLAARGAKDEDRCQQFVEAVIKIDWRPVSVVSEGSNQPLTDIYDNKTNFQLISSISLNWDTETTGRTNGRPVPYPHTQKTGRTEASRPLHLSLNVQRTFLLWQ